MPVKIIRKWSDKSHRYQFGTDSQGNLYCKDNRDDVNLVLIDAYHKRKFNYYYKFMHPVTKEIKLVRK